LSRSHARNHSTTWPIAGVPAAIGRGGRI
jgi:hypothetical protein